MYVIVGIGNLCYRNLNAITLADIFEAVPEANHEIGMFRFKLFNIDVAFNSIPCNEPFDETTEVYAKPNHGVSIEALPHMRLKFTDRPLDLLKNSFRIKNGDGLDYVAKS